ncbi:gibberellin-regulated protein 11-like [Zingiber officinale]|uniref:gibberellin-regulated protein 11-like n=1 Tax=Zingiber officinale TaxID=94328 RepID=UPI001C4DC776|nr:gibberellin-regulated protein 11-like [Zingiber officinale]
MAPRRRLLLLLSPLLASLLLCVCFAAEPGILCGRTGGALFAYTAIDCVGLCGERCKLSSRPNLCKRACRTCCTRCSCVPPGTYGNYDSCPCYGQMTTHGGQRKCP